MQYHYLDNAATTQVSLAAAEAAMHAMRVCYANPASLHEAGIDAERLLTDGKRAVAAALGCQPDCLIMTSGGTESDNTAIFGAASRVKKGGHIITTAVEHPAVTEAVRALQAQGWDATFLTPGTDGCITADQVRDALQENTALVSIMHVNNETGAIMPIAEIASLLKAYNARRQTPVLFHCDGVQAFGHIPVNVTKLGVDFYAVSGHKLHAPKGIGALYIRRGVRIPPMLRGGGQQNGMRSGTEAVPLVSAFGVAAKEAVDAMDETIARMNTLRDRLIAGLSEVSGAQVNFTGGAPHVVSVSVPGLRAEVVMRVLEGEGVCVSTGSACAKGAKSPILAACGLPGPVVDGALRVSFSRFTQAEDVDAFLRALSAAVSRLARR